MVCQPVSQIRTRVETSFHAIGALLDQLAAVAAAFQGYLRQDPSSGIHLPQYTVDFVGAMSHLEAAVRRHQLFRERNSARAKEFSQMMPDIVAHSISLRSCTFTLKVVSARYGEILGFAEEMAGCVNRVRGAVEAMETPLGTMLGMAGDPRTTAFETPEPPPLDEAFHTEPESMRVAAEEIDRMISRLMSTLQSGDIASQRLDHIGQTMEAVEAASLSQSERSRFMAMVADQIEHTLVELESNCGLFTESIDRIAARIGILVENADVHRIRLAGNYKDLQARLEAYFEALLDLLRRQVQQHEQLASEEGLDSPAQLDRQISIMRSAVLDIYYMALNTTLCCGRLGQDASSASPITSEIRFHVLKLTEIVDNVAALMPGLGEVYVADNEARSNSEVDDVLRREKDRLANQVAALAERARQAWLSPGRLQELSDAVLAEIPRLHAVAEGSDTIQAYLGQYHRGAQDQSDLSHRAEELSEKIFAFYTMNSEREVHKKHFWIDIDSSDCDAINVFSAQPANSELDLASVLF